MMRRASQPSAWAWLLIAGLFTIAVYWPGLSGGYLFDDYPNIVNNQALHLEQVDTAGLSRAALSSPSSQIKRPLASLSFAFNHLATGLDPFWMKLTNLAIHLLNGALVFLISIRLIRHVSVHPRSSAGVTAALIAAAWLVLPINLTAVLYVVQRMESLANLFVLLGLLGYLIGRGRMAASKPGLLICAVSLTVPTALGLLVKEPAVMLPLYAFCVEGLLFGFRNREGGNRDRRIMRLFFAVLLLPLVIGLAWLFPSVLDQSTWASRDFSLTTRLLSQARIIASYMLWTLVPNPDWLGFYHDDFRISQGLFTPWTTFASAVLLGAVAAAGWLLRHRAPLVSLGLAFFFAGHLLTGTILPLDLLYEHRNYFPSFGVMLVIVPLLAVNRGAPLALPRHALLAALLLASASVTAMTAHAWGEPLRLAQALAVRSPESPRAQYELGFTYVVNSGYRQDSPFTGLALEQLQVAADLPRSSILAEQALIMTSARAGLPVQDAWWDQLIWKLEEAKPSVDDLTALISLAHCSYQNDCRLPQHRMTNAFLAALLHPEPSARLLGAYAAYAWNTLEDPELALSMATAAVDAAPSEPAYHVTRVRILIAHGQGEQALCALEALKALNTGGRLDPEIDQLFNDLRVMEPNIEQDLWHSSCEVLKQ